MDKSASTSQETPSRLLSIGAVARSSGLSEATLRVWERRYGIPSPVRLPSGHRRYRPEQVRHLRLVAEALAQGSRPGEVLKLPIDDLAGFVSSARKPGPDAEMQGWILSMNDTALRARIAERQRELGLVPFIDSFVGPLLSWIGTAWARGDIEVRHEHFVTEILQDHLRHERMRLLSERQGGTKGTLLLACLPDERHGLGLHMVALLCDMAGVGHRLLGEDTPLDDIAATAAEIQADAVALSIPTSDQGASLYRKVDDLRGRLSKGISLLMGGMGVKRIRRSPSGVERLASMADFETWLGDRFQNGKPGNN